MGMIEAWRMVPFFACGVFFVAVNSIYNWSLFRKRDVIGFSRGMDVCG